MKSYGSQPHRRVYKTRRSPFSLGTTLLLAFLLVGAFGEVSYAQGNGNGNGGMQADVDSLLARQTRFNNALNARLDAIDEQLAQIKEEVTPGRLNRKAEMCIEIVPRQIGWESDGEAKTILDAVGSLGVDVYGIGAALKSKLARFNLKIGAKGETTASFKMEVCWEGPGKQVIGPSPSPVPLLVQAQKRAASQDLEDLADAIETSASLLDDKIAGLADKLEVGPGHLDEKAERVASLIETFAMPTNPFALLDQNFTRDQLLPLATLAPLNSRLKDILNDPGQLLPSNKDAFNICDPSFDFFEIPSTLKGLRDDLCGLNPINFSDAKNTIQDFVAVKDLVDDVITDVSTVSSKVTTVNTNVGIVNSHVGDVKCYWRFGGFFDTCPPSLSKNANGHKLSLPNDASPDETTGRVISTANTLNQMEEALPTDFALEASYPNPFNPRTTIRFDLPQAEYATLKVYDLQGREVATLVSQPMAAGRHRVTWDAGGFASGTYFYRLEAGAFVETKQMLLVK